MKKNLLLVLFLMSIFTLSAQNTGSITGQLVDEANDNPIIGAVIEVYDVAKPDAKKYLTSAGEGSFKITSLAKGTYKVTFSFMGYENLVKEVEVGGSATNLGILKMKEAAQAIDEVKIEVPSMRTSQKGDTVVYNAAAFKVSADADASGLLSKMPGITVTDGQVEAQGETVQRILVDGREFFTGDVSSAITNLPAEVVDRIEVFNKLSDQAEFTGFDDGNSYMALNIITKEDKRTGKFGRLYAGYGIEDKYIVGGSVNFFKTTGGRLTVMALFNNINQRDFTATDILGLSGSSGIGSGGGRMRRGGGMGGGFFGGGISTINAMALNYDNEWWDGKLELSANYSYDNDRNEIISASDGMTYAGGLSRVYTDDKSEREFTNRGHRFNARIEYTINDRNVLMMRPSVSFQNNWGMGTSLSNTQNSDDGGKTIYDVKRQTNTSDMDRDGFSVSNSLIYRLKLNDKGRNIVFNLNGNVNNNNSFSLSDQQIFYAAAHGGSYGAVADSLLKQNIKDGSKSYFLFGGISYSEPLSQKSQLSLDYDVSYNYSDSDRKSYLYDYIVQDFGEEFDPVLSNVYNSGYLTQSIGPSFRMHTQKTNFTVSMMYENSSLKNTQDYPVLDQPKINKSFNTFSYSGMLRINANSSNMFRIRFNSRVNTPSAWDLRNMTDLTNTSNVRAGNPNLKPANSHSVSGMWVKSNAAKGRTFQINVNYSMTRNSMADSLIINEPGFILPNTNGTELGVGNQFVKQINMNGDWNTRVNVSYGFPVKFLSSNLNFDLGAMFNQSPSMINGTKTYVKGQYYDGGVTLGSNISENFDFTLSYRGGYNVSKSTYTVGRNQDNEYWNHYASANMKWVAWAGITLAVNGNYSQYKSLTNSANNQEYTIVNVAIGKKMFKNLGELSFGVNDLFDQNRSFSHFDTSTGYRNMTNNVLSRYYSIKFVYNLRMFGGGVSAANIDQLNSGGRGGRGGRRGGYGGGFGGPGGPGGFRPR
ncbi:MAG: outer membrane beta-barrel protein [Tidjanibacter sp.]|nr:outer membrane beta-barrel protein [Tidjanibacter sp.]